MSHFSRRALLKALGAGLPVAPLLAADPPGKLKITKFALHKSTVRWRDILFLEIHTDGGLVGIGEGSLHGRIPIVEEAIRWLEPQLVGLDPAGPEDHWDRIYYRLTRWRNGQIMSTAQAAVDMALWDLAGKRLGVPVSSLLGGPIRSRLRVYYTHWDQEMKGPRSPEAMAERMIATREKGWTAVKWAIPPAKPEAVRIEKSLEEIAAVRKAAGKQVDICLEMWESFSPRSAIDFAQAVAPYRPLFLEEPVQRENPAALGDVAAKSPVAIATGEGLMSRFEFRQLLERKGASIIQPDVMHCGGITELRKIANFAEVYGVEMAPHQCHGPIAHVASLNAMSVCRNFLIQEWEADDEALFHELTEGTYPTQKEGLVALPAGPGLGLQIDCAAFAKRFPFKPHGAITTGTGTAYSLSWQL